MKNLILILVIALSFSCKKNSKNAATPDKVYCIFYNQTCTGCQARVFYKCASNEDDKKKAIVELRDSGKFSEVVEKTTCSECN